MPEEANIDRYGRPEVAQMLAVVLPTLLTGEPSVSFRSLKMAHSSNLHNYILNNYTFIVAVNFVFYFVNRL